MTEENLKLAARTIISEYISPVLEQECKGVHDHVLAGMVDIMEENILGDDARIIIDKYINLSGPSFSSIKNTIQQEITEIISHAKSPIHEAIDPSRCGVYAQTLENHDGRTVSAQPWPFG